MTVYWAAGVAVVDQLVEAFVTDADRHLEGFDGRSVVAGQGLADPAPEYTSMTTAR